MRRVRAAGAGACAVILLTTGAAAGAAPPAPPALPNVAWNTTRFRSFEVSTVRVRALPDAPFRLTLPAGLIDPAVIPYPEARPAAPNRVAASVVWGLAARRATGSIMTGPCPSPPAGFSWRLEGEFPCIPVRRVARTGGGVDLDLALPATVGGHAVRWLDLTWQAEQPLRAPTTRVVGIARLDGDVALEPSLAAGLAVPRPPVELPRFVVAGRRGEVTVRGVPAGALVELRAGAGVEAPPRARLGRGVAGSRGRAIVRVAPRRTTPVQVRIGAPGLAPGQSGQIFDLADELIVRLPPSTFRVRGISGSGARRRLELAVDANIPPRMAGLYLRIDQHVAPGTPKPPFGLPDLIATLPRSGRAVVTIPLAEATARVDLQIGDRSPLRWMSAPGQRIDVG